MNEKRFVLEISSFSGKHMKFLNILDNGKRLNSEDIVDLLNEQQATINELRKLNNAYAEKFAKIVNLISKDVILDDEQIEQMYLNKLDKRERQIDIMKFHILNFCTDEQIQLIKHDLEIESKLRRCKK